MVQRMTTYRDADSQGALTALASPVDGAAEPLESLAALRALADAVAAATPVAVEAARRGERSWAEVGRALGISRQAAWARFAPEAQRAEGDMRTATSPTGETACRRTPLGPGRTPPVERAGRVHWWSVALVASFHRS